MAEVRATIMTFLRERLGRNVSFGRLSPSVFGQLTITDLTIYSADDPERAVITVSRVRVIYSLLRLLQTRRPIPALREVNFSDSLVTLDWEADRELLDLASRLVSGDPASPGAALAMPSELRVTGSGLTLRFLSKELDIGLSRLSFSLSTGQDTLAVSLKFGLGLSIEGPDLLAGRLEATLSAAGQVAPDFSRADLQVQMQSFAHDRLALRDQTFLLAYRDGLLRLTKIEDRAPIDLELSIGGESRVARLSFRTDSLSPADLFSLRGDWSRYGEWLNGPISSVGEVVLPLDGTDLTYTLGVHTVVHDERFPAPVTLSAAIHGDARRAIVDDISATSDLGSARFSGDLELPGFFPQGLVHVEGFEALVGRRVSGAFVLDREPASGVRPRRLRVVSSAFEFGSLETHDLAGTVDLDTGTAEIALSLLTVPLDAERGPGRVALAGALGFSPRFTVDVSGELASVPLGPLISALQPGRESALPRAWAGYGVTGTVRLSTDGEAYTLDMPTVTLTDPSSTRNQARASFLATNERVIVRSLEAALGGQTLEGAAEVQLTAGRPVGFQSAFALNGIPYEVEGALDQNDLRFSGSYGIEGALVVFPFEASGQDMYFWVESGDMPISVGGVTASTSLSLKGVFPDRDDWFISSSGTRATLRLPNGGQGSDPPVVSAEMDFTLDWTGVTFERLVVSDKVSTVSGAGTLVFLDLSVPVVGVEVSLGGGQSGERYTVSGSYSPNDIRLRVDVAGASVAHLGQAPVSGSLRGTATITGSDRAPVVDGSLALDYGRLNAEPLVLASGLRISGERFDLHDLQLTLGDHRFTGGTAVVDLGSGRFDLDWHYAAEILRDQVLARMTVRGAAPGYRLRDIAALAFPGALDAVLRVSEATVDGTPFPPWSVVFRTEGDTIEFEGGPGQPLGIAGARDNGAGVLGGSLDRGGHLRVQTADPFPLVATLDGRISIREGRIAADLAVERLDLRVLDALIDSDIIEFAGGGASTPSPSVLHIQGPLNDPDFVGSLRLSGGAVRTALSPDTAVPVDTWLHFGPSGDEKAFVLDEVTAPMGKGRITAAAQFTLDHWTPTAFELRLTAEPPTGVRIAWRFGTLVVDGYARGTIRVLHDSSGTRVTSEDLVVQTSKLQMDFTEREEGEEGDPYPLAVDLRIVTGRGVQFTWPQALPILKATARQGSVLRVAYDGSGGELVMEGDVGVLGGSLFFFDRSFSIREGSIAFHENALQFDPRVSVRAEIRERDTQNKEVKIYLEADRVRLSQFSPQTIRFSSDPPLSSAAIMERLGQSVFSRTEIAGIDSPAYEGTGALPLIASLTGDVINQIGFLSPAEDAVRDFLGLDLLSLRTQLVQNFLVDKALALGGALDNTSPALGKYFGNTELTIGKYIGDDLFLELMGRLQTTDERNGFAGLTGLQPVFEVSLEWDTPFFTLDWSLQPKHLEDLLLTDQTLGLRWRYRY
jgi:hypothetical protein